MALLIRAPLDMANGHKVRNLEDLREHFNLEKVLEAYYNGRLLKWLAGLGLEDELDAVQALDAKAPDFAPQICKIFQVPYTGDQVDLEAVQVRMDRLKRLKRVTDETEHHRNIDRVAFNQEELANLVLEDGETTVFLCLEEGEDFMFTIPSSRKGITYYGIPCKGKLPQVRVTRKAWDKLEELDIHLHSCDLQKPVSEQAEQDESVEICEEPVHHFFQQLLQKKSCSSDTELTVSFSVFFPGQFDKPVTFQGTVEQLEEKATELVQKAAAGNGDADNRAGFVYGLEIKEDDLTCQLKMRSDFSARAEIQGIHIERGNDGGRSIYADLLHPVRLNGRKYRSVQILTAEIFQSLDLLKGSEVEVFCLGDLPPAIRVYERGYGKTLRCPHCGSRFVVRDDRVFCENPVCADRLHGRIYRFLQKLGLPYDKFYVQKMITELPIKSIKDLFHIDSTMLEQYQLNSSEFFDFPEKLRGAVSSVPPHTVLGGIGIPELGQSRAKKIVGRLKQTNGSDTWSILVRSLNRLDKNPFEAIIEPEYSKVIQRWLRCDPRTVEVFRDDINELQKYVNHTSSEGIQHVLLPGSKIGTTGFEFTWQKLFEDNQFVHIANKGWWYTHSEIDAVIVPSENYSSGMADYAKHNGIPIFTKAEFLSIFQK